MSERRQRDSTSVRLFFLVLGAIAAYQLGQWWRGEPAWRELVYEPGAFAAQVVGEPDRRTLREEFPFGEVALHFLMFGRGEVQYAIAYGDLPAAIEADSALRAARDLLVEKVRGEVLAERADSLAPWPGRRSHIRAGDGSELLLRCIADGERLYQLMAGGPQLEERAAIEHFFNSFRLLSPAPRSAP